MKVLHVIPSVAPRYGGPSTAIAAMTEALNRIPGVTAEVAATDADGPNRYDLKSWTAEGTALNLFPRQGHALGNWLNANAGKYDVIHSHSAWNTPVFQARLAAVRHRIPLVYRPCGMLSDYSWSRKTLLKYAYWFARESGNVSSASAFHCTSTGEADEVRKHRAARGDIRVFSNGVDSAAWTSPSRPDSLRELCGSKAYGKRIVLFFSRLHPKKGLTEFLLPAIASMKHGVFLAIAGGSDEHAPGYKTEVLAAVEQLGLTDRVALLGTIPSERRWELFDGADIFALPSRSENFGIVVAEAMARGCPVLVTDGVQSSEHVEQSVSGIVTRADVDSVSDGLNQLLGADRDAYGERGRTYAKEHFDWDRIGTALLDLYRGSLKMTF